MFPLPNPSFSFFHCYYIMTVTKNRNKIANKSTHPYSTHSNKTPNLNIKLSVRTPCPMLQCTSNNKDKRRTQGPLSHVFIPRHRNNNIVKTHMFPISLSDAIDKSIKYFQSNTDKPNEIAAFCLVEKTSNAYVLHIVYFNDSSSRFTPCGVSYSLFDFTKNEYSDFFIPEINLHPGIYKVLNSHSFITDPTNHINLIKNPTFDINDVKSSSVVEDYVANVVDFDVHNNLYEYIANKTYFSKLASNFKLILFRFN